MTARAFLFLATLLTGVESSAFTWSGWPSRTEDQPGFTHHPSPPDWRAISIYQLLTDRFYDGNPDNNTANPHGVYNPLSMDSIHGGDFAGITAKLDYIRDLGFRAIWISPVHLNHRGAYHGYHIMDFNAVDPHWGTLAELRTMIDAAHARGIYVFIDVVFNHMARLLMSRDPGFPRFSPDPYRMEWANPDERFAPPFDDLQWFHGHGSIQNWEDHQQNVIGDLQGLADLRTKDPQVREWLLQSHLALIAATDCDGFRIDTAHHVELDFWREILPRLREGAAALGKTNFFIFGEALRHRDEDVSILSREGGFPSMLYYPYFFTLHEVWSSRGPTRLIRERWQHRADYGPEAMDQLVAFADNHDRARLLNEAHLDGDIGRAKAMLALLFASPSIPCVYYGTEQGLAGGKGHRAREPMFHAAVGQPPDSFDPGHELAVWIRDLNHIREAYFPALAKGDTEVLHEENAAGLFVFKRTSADMDALIVMNNSTQPREYEMPPDLVSAFDGQPVEPIIAPDTTLILVPAGRYRPLPPAPASRDPRENARAPAAGSPFVPDGQRDEKSRLIASNETTVLYAAFEPESRMVYFAVTPAAPGYDRFLLVSYGPHAHDMDAPWTKEGTVPAYDILISDEGDSDFTSIRGAPDAHWSVSRRDGVFEAALRMPPGQERLWIRTAAYQTEDGGALKQESALPAHPRRFLEWELK